MIRLVDVRKSFGGKEVIHGIDLTVNDGETLAVIGGSGSGKSTLLRLMIGLIPPTSGRFGSGIKTLPVWRRRSWTRSASTWAWYFSIPPSSIP